jgi:23S rRNA (guanosine2251-2'-O)-methyltransferase
MGRQEQLLCGVHGVLAALEDPASRPSEIWVDVARRDARIRALIERAAHAGVPVRSVARRELAALAPRASSQGVIARYRKPFSGHARDLWRILDELSVPPLLLLLDGVQDPHNLGACLRTAEAAGVHALVTPRDRAVGLTAAACKAASGAAASIPLVRVTNLARLLGELQRRGVWIFGTADDAPTELYDMDLSGSLALVMGGEEKGMRRLTRENCDYLVRIPMAGRVTSLNVSVAAGIALFEAVRQRSRRAQGLLEGSASGTSC